MKFIDLFAGIGGFRLGMEQNGHECVAFCEIDKHARESYKAIHNTKGEDGWHDIQKVATVELDRLRERVGRIDCICGGFPCQSFSIAGKRAGFAETRGTLFFEIVRLAKYLRPAYLFLENVRGLFSHDNGNTFETILRTLDECGYDVQWHCVNSKHFGRPQNRERVYIIATSRKVFGRKGMSRPNVLPLQRADEAYNVAGIKHEGAWEYAAYRMGQSVISTDGVFPTLTTKNGFTDQAKIVVEENGKKRVRKLTPLECWRLQGFSDELFWKAKEAGVSDYQLAKQAGNSVTVNVIASIAAQFPEPI